MHSPSESRKPALLPVVRNRRPPLRARARPARPAGRKRGPAVPGWTLENVLLSLLH